MKTRFPYGLLILALLVATNVRGAEAPLPMRPPPPSEEVETAAPTAKPALTKFDLDFPGGTPVELVAAISKAMGRPLNTIILDSDAQQPIPALKLKGVNAAQLFAALREVSIRSTIPNELDQTIAYAFECRGTPSDDSIWYFRRFKQAAGTRNCQFFLLKPYLDSGLTVDDIATAIQTASKMQNEFAGPVLSFHKETGLLIAVGLPGALQTVRDALNALEPLTRHDKARGDAPSAGKKS